MANSLSFAGENLSTYGLVVTSHDLPIIQDAQTVRLQNKAYAWRSSLTPKAISLGTTVTAVSRAALITAVDNINSFLDTREDAELILDILSTRYWNARFESFHGGFISQVAWRGNLTFMALDPLAFSTTLTSSVPLIDVNADPDTLDDETPGGTANTNPVYTLTAGIAGATVLTLENLTTGLALGWSGTIANIGDELIIDVANKLVTLEATPSMATVTGRFPYLLPTANSIKATGWGTAGTLDIVYRARYL
ncbi:MAG TPA: hypothetical protein VMV84_05200 [Dehalococcoidales bacterium]|nr:hypothetical protein [Dehalococcoidales bacterium]